MKRLHPRLSGEASHGATCRIGDGKATSSTLRRRNSKEPPVDWAMKRLHSWLSKRFYEVDRKWAELLRWQSGHLPASFEPKSLFFNLFTAQRPLAVEIGCRKALLIACRRFESSSCPLTYAKNGGKATSRILKAVLRG